MNSGTFSSLVTVALNVVSLFSLAAASQAIEKTSSVEGIVTKIDRTAKTLLRIAQEALNNVVRHAYANKVNIELAFSDEQLRLSVQDDGIAFRPECRPVGAGFGLTSIWDRASALGGIC